MAEAASPDTTGLSPATMAQLQQIGDESPDSNTIAFFPLSTMVYFTLLYMSAKLCERLFLRYSIVYRETMTAANRRTSVIYILNIVITTVALALQLAACPALAQDYTERGINCLRVAAVLITGLYLFELIYRDSMRPQMLLHHFATIFAICLVNGVLAETHHPSLIVTGLVWLFQATTEQLSFVALLMYRLHYSAKSVMWLLRISAVQSFIPKIVFGIYLIVWWAQKQIHLNTTLEIAFSVVLFVCVSVLMFTQVYGCWILWKVGDSVMRRSLAGAVVVEKEVGQDWGTATPVNQATEMDKVDADGESIAKMCRTSSLAEQAAFPPSLPYNGAHI